jgi:hypothetical protein
LSSTRNLQFHMRTHLGSSKPYRAIIVINHFRWTVLEKPFTSSRRRKSSQMFIV